MKNPTAFFDHVRRTIAGGSLTESQVLGCNLFVAEAERRTLPLNRFANILGQVFWETGKTMAPVKEAYYLGGKAEAYRKKLRYYPYYGRGHIQNTWKHNYEKLSNMWEDMTGQPIDFVSEPDLLLLNKYSIPITFEGFARGIWTGKDSDDYIDLKDESDDEDLREYANARRLVNGTDRQVTIGKISLEFERALKAGGYGLEGVPEAPEPVPVPPKPTPPPRVEPAPVPPPEPPGSFWSWLKRKLLGDD
jgi:hypothetical protein